MPSSSRCSVASSNGVQLPVVRQVEATSVVEFLDTLRYPNANSTPHLYARLRLPLRVCGHPRSRAAA